MGKSSLSSDSHCLISWSTVCDIKNYGNAMSLCSIKGKVAERIGEVVSGRLRGMWIQEGA